MIFVIGRAPVRVRLDLLCLVVCAECARAAYSPPQSVINLPPVVDPFTAHLTVYTRARSPRHVLLAWVDAYRLDFKKLLLRDLSVREHLPLFPALDPRE